MQITADIYDDTEAQNLMLDETVCVLLFLFRVECAHAGHAGTFFVIGR